MPVDIITAIRDPRLIGDEISEAQETALRALYGLPMNATHSEIYMRATERTDYEQREYREASYICGRRSGKSSKLASNIALFEGCFRTHPLSRGERAFIVTVATTRRQASVVFNYILARLENSPTLHRLIDGEPRADEVDLRNGVTISVWPCNYRSIRGISIAACICDELAFWRDDLTGANPATEVLRAIRPSMASFSSAKLVKISSPFAKSGPVWDDWQLRHSRPDTLVWRLDSRSMNPTLDAAFLNAERERDPEAYAREYGAEFYESAASFLSADAIESAVVPQRWELPPESEMDYTASLDAAFRGDNFAFAIVHRAGDRVVQDTMRAWRGSRASPVNLAETLEEIVSTLHRYGIARIHGDQFCSEPIRQALAAQGVEFVQSPTMGARATGIWSSLRTLVAAHQIELLDDAETIAELKRLELVVTSGGNQRVEAATGHDDRAVALALAAHMCVAAPAPCEPWVEYVPFRRDEQITADSERGWTKISS
jgi:hypothetical protein